jgi:hypothetical protein
MPGVPLLTRKSPELLYGDWAPLSTEVRGFTLSLTLYDTQSKEILPAVYGNIT